MPGLYIITGSNGAGKSSFGVSYLPVDLQAYNIFDGDKLFTHKKQQLYKIETPSYKEAGRRALEWLHEYFETCVDTAIKNNDHFIYEGHLPEDGNWITPQRFKAAGYDIHFIFFGLNSIELSAERVFERAVMGGHNVPLYEIERNFMGNLYQLNRKYKTLDSLQIIDTSESINPLLLAVFLNGRLDYSVYEKELPEWFKSNLPALYKEIKDDNIENTI
ncbi:MAG: zeta toxin family protein [Ferruginibacter sp.]